MIDSAATIDPRRLLIAIAGIEANPDQFTKDEVVRMLGIAGAVIGQVYSLEECDIDDVMEDVLAEMEPEGSA